MNNKRTCINCEHYKLFQGVMECWNRDSDNMYTPTLPDDTCGEFDGKEDDNNDTE